MLKRNYIFSICICVTSIISCTYDIEVHDKEAAVAYNKENGEVFDDVYLTGSHTFGSEIGLKFYNIQPKDIEFSFDFLFADVSSGEIEFLLNYTPIPKKLPPFFKEHKGENLEAYFMIEVRKVVRKEMKKYSKESLNKGLIFDVLEKLLTQKSEMVAYVKIEKFTLGDITYK